MSTKIDEAVERIREDLNVIGDRVLKNVTLGDLIREGSSKTTQSYTWGDGESACALSAAYLAARARGLTD
jgi:hypothetical protein